LQDFRVTYKAHPPVRLEIDYTANSVPGEGDLPVVEVYVNNELAFTGMVPRQLNKKTKITASFELKPGANLMKIVVFDYATVDLKHQFQGWGLLEAYDAKESLFGGTIEPPSPKNGDPVSPADSRLVYSIKEELIEFEA